jgi:hypothetical protein
LGTWYSVKAGDDVTLWDFSSASMAPGHPHGYTLHADYFEAWDPGVKARWHAACIDTKLNCSGGDMGDGKQLIGALSLHTGSSTRSISFQSLQCRECSA